MARIRLTGQRVRFKELLGSDAERKADLREAGVAIAVQLQNRTMSGKGNDNRKFRPYTTRYAKWKGVGQGQVDLFLSGDMLNSLDVLDVSPRDVKVGFTSGAMADRADYNASMGRPFTKIPKAWVKELERTLLFRRIAKGQ